jgi:hypothetical protein
VLRQLEGLLPEEWSATLHAVDGDRIEDVPSQLARVPDSATHLVLSVGGNDALGHIDVLQQPARSVAEVLDSLATRVEPFEAAYRALLLEVVGRGLPLTVCTIYNGNFPDPRVQRLTRTALTLFNDAILRAAFAHELPVIDLRLVCSDPADYANPIEPSVQGGARIAHAIVRALLEPADLQRQTRVIASA